MPTYDYECGVCGRFQYSQRITEPALDVCPTCGQPVRRLISRNVNIIFKGPGFYITDNRKIGGSHDDKKQYAVSKEDTKDRATAGSSTNTQAGAQS